MIELFALAVVELAALYFLWLAAMSFLKPVFVAGFLNGFASSARVHYLEMALRILVEVVNITAHDYRKV